MSPNRSFPNKSSPRETPPNRLAWIKLAGLARGAGIPALVGAALLAGCAAGPNFRTPAAPGVTSFQMKGDAPLPGTAAGDAVSRAPAAGAAPADARSRPIRAPAAATPGGPPWWTAFGSPDLDAVMDAALAHNLTLAAADATLRAARAAESAEAGGAFPRADATASEIRERINTTSFGFTGFPSPTIQLYSIGASVSYDLDLFGGRRRRIESAAARAEAQGRRAEAAYLTLTGKVAQQVFLVAALRGQVDAAGRVVDGDRANVDALRRAEAAGGSSRNVSVSASSQLALDLARLAPLKRRLAQARHGLALLVGKAPAEWSPPDFDLAGFAAPPRAPSLLPSELVRARPDILAAEADLHAATADIGVATAALFPSLSLGASLTQTSLSTSELFARSSSGWIVGPSITAPLFHGGALRANRRGAEARAQEALARYRETVLEAFVQVADVMEALARDDEEVGALEDAVQTSDSRLATAHQGFEKGGLAWLDVLDAQRQADHARQDLLEAQGRRLADFAMLYVAVGADWRAAAKSEAPPPT